MNKIKKFFLNFWYGLPFGMKAMGDEIMGSNAVDSNGTTVGQEVSDERVAKHLLKGEVTQEVEELRYRTYKVENESKNYKYIGNGVVVKENKVEKERDRTKFKFTQESSIVCESVSDSLKQVGSYGTEKYMFEIDYNSLVRFRVEKFITKIDVDINDDIEKVETTLHFSTEPNPYDAASMPFINEIKKLLDVKSEYEASRHEISSSIVNLTFTTYKAYNEADFVNYCFINGAKFKSFKQEGYEYLLTFEWDEYIRMPLDLETKYYSKSMAEKYEKKERKNVDVSVVQGERKRYCSICGKEMSVYDADIQEADGHEPICKECMKQVLNKQE